VGKPEALSDYSDIKCRKLELWLSQERVRVKENQNKSFMGKKSGTKCVKD